MNGKAPEITVIVPTHNRPDSLRRCLARLAAQTSEIPIEIVVVDDGSDDPERVADVVAETSGARLIRQPRRGPGAARNTGVQAAKGSVLCFTDDDCEPRADWARRLAHAVLDGASVVAGTTANGQTANWFATASQLQAEYFTHNSAVPFAASNNIASTTAVLLAVPFDDRYRQASEDRDWCDRLTRRGYRIEYEPAAGVYHHQQLTLRSFLRQQTRYGRGSYRYHSSAGHARSLERPGFYTSLLGHGFREGVGIGLVVALGQLAIGFGYLREWLLATRQRRFGVLG